MTGSLVSLDGAQQLLERFGLPARQCNRTAAYVLLAISSLPEQAAWASAERRLLRIHDLLEFVRSILGKSYAENTRESFRRRTLHYFEQARMVDRNPDRPSRPTNSKNTCYALTHEALAVVKAFGGEDFAGALAKFQSIQPTLRERYAARKARSETVIELPEIGKIRLSPGKHNQLQRDVIELFWPRFVPNAKLLYLGDTADKDLYCNSDGLQAAGVPHSIHDKLPDLVFRLADRNWLILIEAVTSHGPCSPKRRHELEELLRDCPLHRVYVSAFPTMAVFKKFLGEIAWDTEVWTAEVPEHMIHFNGPKFLGPAAPHPPG